MMDILEDRLETILVQSQVSEHHLDLIMMSNPIFVRQFDGASTTGVNTTTNQITLPNHFYQSGEAVKYTITGVDQRIGIVTTDFGGSVGSTSLLQQICLLSKLMMLKLDLPQMQLMLS